MTDAGWYSQQIYVIKFPKSTGRGSFVILIACYCY
jgi:hypothetical protein